jgi:hypothetical protein
MPAIHEMTAITCSALIHSYIAYRLVPERSRSLKRYEGTPSAGDARHIRKAPLL